MECYDPLVVRRACGPLGVERDDLLKPGRHSGRFPFWNAYRVGGSLLNPERLLHERTRSGGGPPLREQHHNRV
jgi:hypothetical protein